MSAPSAKTSSKKKRQKRDPEKTRAKLLECATHCFAKAGFEGTSLSHILKEAQINKRMVYHYYGSKAKLYREVHLQQWRSLSNWFAQALASNAESGKTDVASLLIQSVEIFHDFSATHQDFLRLLMWDGLEGGVVSRSIWEDIRGPIYRQIEGLIHAAQQQGVLPAELEASHLIVSFMGSILLYFAYSKSLLDIFEGDPLQPAAVQHRKIQMLRLFAKIFQ